MIKATNKITGSLNASIIKQYPELEDITIKPTFEEQKLKSIKYGFDNVIVEGIPATDLEITPSFEEQVKEGIFKEVTVGAIPQETLNITPTEQEQSRKGIFTEVNIDAIKAQEIVPELNFNGNGGVELKLEDGEYIKKATIYRPESLTGDNIKTGVTIFGITGGLADTSDGTVVANDVVAGKIAYANNKRVVGTIPDNGELEFEPSDEEQEIPTGLTSGGIVKAADITRLAEYEACLTLANSIDNLEDYTETTATPEDIKEGKVAYSNGERIVGTMKISDNNTDMAIELIPGNNSGGFNQLGNLIRKLPNDVTFKANSSSCMNMFFGCTLLEEVPLFDTSKVSVFTGMFYNCHSLKKIPPFNTNNAYSMTSTFHNCKSITSIPNLNTGRATNVSNMCTGCINLVTVPLLDTSKVTNGAMDNMFLNCTSLSDESLNNILQMCINSTNVTYTAYKKLSRIGLTSEQATRCQSLSNYQAFLDAGWTTGY